jgi:iron-sulfur cluster assembly protein
LAVDPRRKHEVLTVTPTAAEVVRELVAGSPVDDDGGLRIAPGAPTPAGTPLEVAVADSPEVTDQTVDEGGARVFVAADAAEFLDDKVLDARVDEGQLRFTITGTEEDDTDSGPPGAF